MKKNYFLIIIAVLILLAAIVLRIRQVGTRSVEEQNNDIINSAQNQEEDSVATNTDELLDSEPTLGEVEEEAAEDELMISAVYNLSSPVAGETVSSPLQISGEITGTWFFEANLPLKLVDSNNNLIAEGYGEAQSDWMTEGFVPFIATINYSTQASSGYLVIMKNNPSGLAQFDDEILVPINF